jgi:hypothetical protein
VFATGVGLRYGRFDAIVEPDAFNVSIEFGSIHAVKVARRRIGPSLRNPAGE